MGAGAGQIVGGQRASDFQDVVERPLATTSPPRTPAPGTDVDDIIGGADGILVMFDDDDRVAEIAQPLQRDEQAVVVALVQADRGFVEDVEDAGKAAADLAGEADSLGFAAA